MSIKEVLQTQRRVLLDLTYRNRLLSLPKRKSSRSITVFDELCAEVYRLLVREKKHMSFAPLREGVSDTEELSSEEKIVDEDDVFLPQPEGDSFDERGVASRHVDTKLQTKLKSEHLQKRLLEILYDAQTMLEEQGVNILYLALGQLRYFDPAAATEAKLAPLVLVPVRIERKSVRDRFALTWTEEDPTENLSLVEKLRVDFKLRMPEFPALDDIDLAAYFAAVREAIGSQARWQVEENAMQLGFFSFAKLLLFRDLDPANWPETAPIDTHGLIGGLLGQGFPGLERDFGHGQTLDELLPVASMCHVMDCDSSQALAIEAVRSGQNLVIQGPPGTGKSQTIANIIATAVSDGKKVLFVAEKMAALEVVKRRLTNVQLGPLCLELHSNRSNKRQVLEELARTLEIGRPAHVDVAGPVEQLTQLRDQLNRHSEKMHSPSGAAGLTPFRILGELSRRQALVARPAYRLPGAEGWTHHEVHHRANLLAELCRQLSQVGDPRVNAWRGVQRAPVLRPMAEEMMDQVGLFSSALIETCVVRDDLARRLGLCRASTLRELQQQCRVGELLANAPKFDRSAISSAIWNAGLESLRQAVKSGEQLSQILLRRRDMVSESAWDMDWTPQRLTIAAHGRSFFRWLNGSYRRALAQLRGVARGEVSQVHDERVELLDDLIAGYEAKKVLASAGGIAQSGYGAIWRSLDTDWSLAKSILGWVETQSHLVPGLDLRMVAANLREPEGLREGVAHSRVVTERTVSLSESLAKAFCLQTREAFATESIDLVALDALRERVALWASDLDGLMKWLDYRQVARQVSENGLDGVADFIISRTERLLEAVDQFWLAYYLQLLSVAEQSYPELARFDGRRHGELVAQFRTLDRKRLELAQVETAVAHYQRMPKVAASFGAMGMLKGEMARKRGHMSLRKLLKLCGSPIQAIKPVFMMSPLSVAQFLEPGAVEFDLLVIDEASQIQPVDALGAIARSRQIVVVGDDKQLPPTAFFSRLMADDDHDPEADQDGAEAKDLESILSLCVSKGLPSKMLQWHYRSRHESLIAVSNKEFYEGKLFIVPSPDRTRSNLGLKLNYLPEGRFDRGSSQKNHVEAAAIAASVLAHARNTPELTLGVGAMSMRQRQAISDELELARRQHPELEQFFASHVHEPFFIKNLENIQGDERDVILISIGYARSKSDDKLYQNFGPLLLDGGHRRLNVLITRARQRCEVFTSILPDDIRIDERSKHGLIALKTFLKYAHSGDLGIPTLTGRGVDSPFEEAVQNALFKHGLQIDNQVGVAGFFIDLAVVDPDVPGRYLLGIECDGAAYHSAPSARDRDRLRQEILEAHDWTIHRIWSTDWFQKPKEELERVLGAVAAARDNAARKAASKPNMAAEVGSAIVRHEPASPELSREASISLAYVEVHFTPGNLNLAPHLVPLHSMAFTVEKIVGVEGPIHLDEVVARVRDLWGLGRAGARIQGSVESALLHLARSGKVHAEGDCYILPGQVIPVRDRSNAISKSLKRPECLPPQEIREAIVSLVREVHGIPREEVPIAVSRALGFQATSQQLREKIEPQIDVLLDMGRIKVESGYLKVLP